MTIKEHFEHLFKVGAFRNCSKISISELDAYGKNGYFECTKEGIEKAIAFCKEHKIEKFYNSSIKNGYYYFIYKVDGIDELKREHDREFVRGLKEWGE